MIMLFVIIPLSTCFIMYCIVVNRIWILGNILAILALPRFGGFYVRGAAASAVLNFPIAGHLLRMIGLIDVSREVITPALNSGEVS